MKGGNNPLGGMSPQEAANRTWGGGDPPSELAATKREKIELIPIADIRPDYQQPRRAVPYEIRRVFVPDFQGLISIWFDMSGASQLNIAGMIEGTYELPEGFEINSLLETFLRLVDLAGSIHRSGLTNPITVVASADGYVLETGERRWLAHHLLHAIYEDRYDRIPARIMPAFDIWRQATENNARDDLNAIGRARQLAILLMDVIGGDQFQPLEAFDHEQEYYAQVADGELYRTPRGTAPRIVAAMGLRNQVQLRQYRALLRLPRALWIKADDENWTERQLRDYSVTGVTVSSEAVSPPPLPAGTDSTDDPAEDTGLSHVLSEITNITRTNSAPLKRVAGWGRGDMNRLKRLAGWGEEIVIEDEIDRRRRLDEIGQARLALEEMQRRLGG